MRERWSPTTVRPSCWLKAGKTVRIFRVRNGRTAAVLTWSDPEGTRSEPCSRTASDFFALFAGLTAGGATSRRCGLTHG